MCTNPNQTNIYLDSCIFLLSGFIFDMSYLHLTRFKTSSCEKWPPVIRSDSQLPLFVPPVSSNLSLSIYCLSIQLTHSKHQPCGRDASIKHVWPSSVSTQTDFNITVILTYLFRQENNHTRCKRGWFRRCIIMFLRVCCINSRDK